MAWKVEVSAWLGGGARRSAQHRRYRIVARIEDGALPVLVVRIGSRREVSR